MITTERLKLIPATPELAEAAIAGGAELGAKLGARVPESWPPELLDQPALEFMRNRLREGPEQEGWWIHFILLGDGGSGRVLVGGAGYKGPPSEDGTVEVGYGIVRDHQRQGYASEAVRGLVAGAFGNPAVRRVIAETLPELTASIGVLRKCGFTLIGEGSDPGVIRFELTRDEYRPNRSAW